MSDSSSTILVRKERGVMWITLNRPEVLNALDLATLKKLQTVLKEAEFELETKCVVITGMGRAFCAGADLQSLKTRSASEGGLSLDADLREGLNPIVSKIFNMEKPVIAMVNGVAAGA